LANSPYEEGTPDRKICILAEAPAHNEIRANQPLVGMSGILFNECLHAASIVRAECYILNVFPYEVFKDKTDNKIFNRQGDLLWTAKGGFTAFGMQEASTCLKKLERSQANVTVPLGGVALSLLYGDSRIMKWRGSILESNHKAIRPRKIVPTLHPAYSLRGNYPARFTIQADLRRVREESTTKQILLPQRELIIDPAYNEVIAFLSDLKKTKRFATDIEVVNHQISCLSFAPSPSLSMSIPLLDSGNRPRWTEEQEAEIWLSIAEVMEDDQIEKINQNILFDIAFELEQNNIFTRGTTHCTMCLQHILYPDFPKGLDYICSIRTREPYYKDDGKIWQKPWVDLDRFWTYNAKDSAVALEAFDDAYTEIEGYEWTYQRTLDLFRPLMFMMVKGIKVDRARLARTNTEIKARIASLEKELRDVAEWDFNPGSPKQCQEYFYVTKGIKPYVSSKTGSITCDDKAMARIYKRYQLPEAKLVQEIRSLRKLHSSYLEVGIDPDDRIRCSYNPRGTTTGRLSSSETVRGTGMNLQNLHSEFKDFLVADDDG
jgi:uracil-DNA glycosylase